MIQLHSSVVIAIDGYSSCGKSSFARQIARELDYIYIDSGAMYRAMTLFALRNNLIVEKNVNVLLLEKQLPDIHIDFRLHRGKGIYETFLNGENVEEEIRSMHVSEHVSEISKLKPVRTRLVRLQQQLGEHKGIVMDGRDIGTVVFPHAEIKIFMTASIEVRALRRYNELKSKNIPASLDEIRFNLERRDSIDQNRSVSPLRKAEDAVLLDNSLMTPGDQMVWFKKLLENLF